MNFNQFLFIRIKTGKFYKENLFDPGLVQGLYAKYYMAMYFKKNFQNLKTHHISLPGIPSSSVSIPKTQTYAVWKLH